MPIASILALPKETLMCGGFPSSSTQGPPPPRMTLWEAIAILWHGEKKDAENG